MASRNYAYETVRLDRVRFAATCAIDHLLAAEAWTQERVRDQLVYQVKAEIFGRQLERVRVAYPADWWQAVKDRFAPLWFRRRWPVRVTEWEVDVRQLIPDLPLQPRHTQVLHVQVFRNGAPTSELHPPECPIP